MPTNCNGSLPSASASWDNDPRIRDRRPANALAAEADNLADANQLDAFPADANPGAAIQVVASRAGVPATVECWDGHQCQVDLRFQVGYRFQDVIPAVATVDLPHRAESVGGNRPRLHPDVSKAETKGDQDSKSR